MEKVNKLIVIFIVIVTLGFVGYKVMQSDLQEQNNKPVSSPAPTFSTSPSPQDDPCLGAFNDLDTNENCVNYQKGLEQEYHSNPLKGTLKSSKTALTITNNSDFDWNSCNTALGFENTLATVHEDRGFMYFFSLLSGKSITITWQEFKLNDYTPLEYSDKYKPDSIDIRCDSVGGKKSGSVFKF